MDTPNPPSSDPTHPTVGNGAENAELEKKLDATRRENENISKQLSELEEKLKDTEKDLQSAKKAQSEIEKNRDQQGEVASKLEEALSQEKARSESLSEEMQNIICQKDEANTHRAGLSLDVEKLKSELNAAHQELNELKKAQGEIQRGAGEVHRQLDEALRRLDGLQQELVAEGQKVEALITALRRITSHRWYRLWDGLRRILGKSALHGSREDPLGIKSGMPM